MINLDVTFFWQLLNFIVVLFLLNAILFKPIRGMLKKRTDLMVEQLNDIERFAQNADAKLEQYETSLNETRKQGQQIRLAASTEGQAEEKALIEAASAEAAKSLEAARAKAAAEEADAQKALQADVPGFAEQVAEKILGRA